MNGSSSGPRIAALQRAWLRELGVERPWLPAASAAFAAVPAARAAQGAPATSRAPAAGRDEPVSRPASRLAPLPERPASPEAGRRAAPAQGTAPGVAPAPPQRRPAGLAPAGAAAGTPAAAAGTAVRPEVESADLDALREQVVGCTACGLCAGRRQAVFGDGARPARWMVVGEAPGEQEDRQGLPFVGRSGQLLDAMLAAVGMSRQRDVFIANVIKCRPPGNRNPRPEEIAACSPYLMRQIALLQPERILVLGRFAAQTLLGTEATIGSLRGRLHTMRSGEREIPLVVSYHPAYLLRSPHEKAKAWQDLRLAAGRS